MSSIPEDVYLEILLRVPVKTTFVCKCVCKSWFALISSPSFVNNITIRKNNPTFMFKGFHDVKRWVFCSIGYEKLSSSMNEFDDAVVYMDYPPFKVPEELVDIQFLGCFNGVVFLSNFLEKKTLCLWNPATKEYKEIPMGVGLPQSLDRGKPKIYFRTVMYGFGYDYKAVYVYKDVDKDICLANIYSLESNSWKSIQPVPYLFPDHRQKSAVLANGALHWLGKMHDTCSSNVIISLDMRDEQFKELRLPKESLENNHTFISVGELKGVLILLVEVVKARVEVWVLQDYGVQESWTKHYVITHEKILRRTNCMQLLWIFENDEMLFTLGELVVYDPKSQSYREPKTCITLSPLDRFNYFEHNIDRKT